MANSISVDLIPGKKSRKARVRMEIRKLFTNLYVALSFLPVLAFLMMYGILYFYNIQISKDVDKINRETAEIENRVDLDKKAEVERFSARLDTLKFLLDKHNRTAGVFKAVENLTHPRVSFDNFNFNTKEGVVVLRGSTESYRTLAEQIISLQQNSQISDLKITNVKLELGGEVTFNMSFKVAENIYK